MDMVERIYKGSGGRCKGGIITMVEQIRKDSWQNGCKGWIMDMVERIYKGSGRTDVKVGIWTWYNGFIKVLEG